MCVCVWCADEVGKQAPNAPHNKKEKRRGENFKKAPCSRDSKPSACVVYVCVCVCVRASISNSTDVGHVCRQKREKKIRITSLAELSI